MWSLIEGWRDDRIIMVMLSQLLFLSLVPELQIAVSKAAETAIADMLIVTGIPAIFTNEWSFHK